MVQACDKGIGRFQTVVALLAWILELKGLWTQTQACHTAVTGNYVDGGAAVGGAEPARPASDTARHCYTL